MFIWAWLGLCRHAHLNHVYVDPFHTMASTDELQKGAIGSVNRVQVDGVVGFYCKISCSLSSRFSGRPKDYQTLSGGRSWYGIGERFSGRTGSWRHS